MLVSRSKFSVRRSQLGVPRVRQLAWSGLGSRGDFLGLSFKVKCMYRAMGVPRAGDTIEGGGSGPMGKPLQGYLGTVGAWADGAVACRMRSGAMLLSSLATCLHRDCDCSLAVQPPNQYKYELFVQSSCRGFQRQSPGAPSLGHITSRHEYVHPPPIRHGQCHITQHGKTPARPFTDFAIGEDMQGSCRGSSSTTFSPIFQPCGSIRPLTTGTRTYRNKLAV